MTVGIGFSFRVAPGVRLRVTNRGLRASLGPRSARLHVGGGRPAISAGSGPFTAWTTIGGSTRRAGGASASGGHAAYVADGLSPAAASKAEEAARLTSQLAALRGLHNVDYPPAQEPAVRPLVPPTLDVLVAQACTRHGIRSGRGAEAQKLAALREAQAEARELWATCETETAHRREALARRWRDLLANEPYAVMGTLVAAFQDNQALAAAVDVEGAEARIVVLVPDVLALPDRVPGTTATGAVSLRKAKKGELNELHFDVVCGHVLATLKETFAVAPRIEVVSIVAVQERGDGAGDVEPVLAARVARPRLAGLAGQSASAMLEEAASGLLVNLRGSARTLTVLPLAAHPDLAALIAAFEHSGSPSV